MVGPKRFDGPMHGEGSNEEGKILKIELFRCDPKGGSHPPGTTSKIQCERSVFMNIGDIRYRTEPFYSPQGKSWSHEGEGFIHLARGPVDFLNDNTTHDICHGCHAMRVVVVALPLTQTPGYAVSIKG
jgi:hypothetical protein